MQQKIRTPKNKTGAQPREKPLEQPREELSTTSIWLVSTAT
jgi:hypothetical protein